MADFDVALVSGFAFERWIDPPDPNVAPSRINPVEHAVPLFYRVVTLFEVAIRALVGGVLVNDAGLGGRLFSGYMLEWPLQPFGIAQPPITQPTVGTSADLRFTPPAAGHYTVVIRRPEGGRVILHLDATDA